MRPSVRFVLFAAAAIALNCAVAAAVKKDRRLAVPPTPVSSTAVASAVSAPLRGLAVAGKSSGGDLPGLFEPIFTAPSSGAATSKGNGEAAFARTLATPMPTPLITFDGMNNFDNGAAFSALFLPPDTTGDIGPQHYVQVMNSLVRVYDRRGTPLTAPIRLNDLFAPLNTICSTRYDGLPVVLYDRRADRWLITQTCSNNPPFRQMMAVSQTGDPAGAYYLYEFVMPNIRIPDFPKYAIWQSGFFLSTEEFIGADYYGEGMYAFDRSKMLVGDPSASYVYFSRSSDSVLRRRGMLPVDLDGTASPNGPELFASFDADEYGDSGDALRIYSFTPNFADPLASTFTELPESPIAVAAFDPTSNADRRDITQPAPGDFLDANSDRLNFRASYRVLPSSGILTLSQTVRTGTDPYRAGVRLYTLTRPVGGGAFQVTENATIGDGTSSRWISSAATDGSGNVAVSYSHVSDTSPPSIRYTGRLASEPQGSMRSEAVLWQGDGVQTAFGWRWGDYASMTVDPVDECTFWTLGAYYTLASQQQSDFGWLTRVGTFRFPECTDLPAASLAGTVTNAVTGQPIAGALVTNGNYIRSTAANGGYGPVRVIPGTYQFTASKRGYQPATASVNIPAGTTATRDFSLTPIPVIETAASSVIGENCGLNGAPEPGENVSFSLTLQNNGAINAANVTATLRAANGVTQPGPPQNYGALAAAGQGVTRTFTFRVDPAANCGSNITLAFDITDGSTAIGTVSITLRAGAEKIAFAENFDRRMQAQVPPRWMRAESHTDEFEPQFLRDWHVSPARGSKAAYGFAPQYVGVSTMTTPVFYLTSSIAKVRFRNWYDLETTFLRNRLYDGSVLEIKIGDADWQDIIAAGGAFESGGYDGTIDSCCQNPLAGKQGWSGHSGIDQVSQYINTVVRMPPSAAGKRVQLRWRIGTDVGTWREGQYIDDLTVTDGYTCGCAIP